MHFVVTCKHSINSNSTGFLIQLQSRAYHMLGCMLDVRLPIHKKMESNLPSTLLLLLGPLFSPHPILNHSHQTGQYDLAA
jgi:hypothetical protein